MKPIYYHIINAGIAGALVFLGSLTPVLSGDGDTKGIILGLELGLVLGFVIFLNKFNDWFSTQDPDCPKIMHFF